MEDSGEGRMVIISPSSLPKSTVMYNERRSVLLVVCTSNLPARRAECENKSVLLMAICYGHDGREDRNRDGSAVNLINAIDGYHSSGINR